MARRSVPDPRAPARGPRRAARGPDPGLQEETGLPGRPALDGHAARRSPEICSRIVLADARQRDHDAIGHFRA
jgi:hypothetical protein